MFNKREEEDEAKLQLRNIKVKLDEVIIELESEKAKNSLYVEDRKILDE